MCLWATASLTDTAYNDTLTSCLLLLPDLPTRPVQDPQTSRTYYTGPTVLLSATNCWFLYTALQLDLTGYTRSAMLHSCTCSISDT